MTRFARAHGSKGANDKKPEEATSWSELKEAMLVSQKKITDAPSENKDVNKKEIPSVQEIEAVWADLVDSSKKGKKCKKRKIPDSKETLVESNAISEEIKKAKKQKKGAEINENLLHATKERKGKKKRSEPNVFDKSCLSSTEENKDTTKSKVTTNGLEQSDTNIINDANRSISKKATKNKKQTTLLKIEAKGETTLPCVSLNTPKMKGRRKAALQASSVLINGKPVKVCPFDGFLVQAEDAERLLELRKNMIEKGIPKFEREKSLKLERRRAEKALARLKKQVCFQCRRSGHNLSDCPQIAEDQRATGICYKCGSTEHTHFQCRVTKSADFRYAECFICKEQGHIAKQCPDNPRGLYPRGGACATCGDVTHLKKDCPKYLAEKEDETVTVGTRNNRALEAIDEDLEVKRKTAPLKKLNKHIKF